MTDENRRNHGRLRCSLLRCQLGSIRDISATGARMRGRRRRAPEIGEMVLLKVRCLDLGVAVWGQVIWARRSGMFHFEVGVRFVDVGPSLRTKISEIARVAVDRHLIASAPSS